MTYAGFWTRFLASFIDGLILLIPSGILALLSAASGDAGAIFDLLSIVMTWLYFALLESSAAQATFGKQALGIVVVTAEGRRLSFGRATGRYFAKILSYLILMIGFIMAAFTARKQALHDIIASTLVVDKKTLPTEADVFS